MEFNFATTEAILLVTEHGRLWFPCARFTVLTLVSTQGGIRTAAFVDLLDRAED